MLWTLLTFIVHGLTFRFCILNAFSDSSSSVVIVTASFLLVVSCEPRLLLFWLYSVISTVCYLSILENIYLIWGVCFIPWYNSWNSNFSKNIKSFFTTLFIVTKNTIMLLVEGEYRIIANYVCPCDLFKLVLFILVSSKWHSCMQMLGQPWLIDIVDGYLKWKEVNKVLQKTF